MKVVSMLNKFHKNIFQNLRLNGNYGNFYKLQSQFFSKIKKIGLGDLGEGMKEGEIKDFYVKEGDLVEEFDNVVGMKHDKASVDLPTPVKGRVKKIFSQVGDTINVGTTIMEIEIEEEGNELNTVQKNEKRSESKGTTITRENDYTDVPVEKC